MLNSVSLSQVYRGGPQGRKLQILRNTDCRHSKPKEQSFYQITPPPKMRENTDKGETEGGSEKEHVNVKWQKIYGIFCMTLHEELTKSILIPSTKSHLKYYKQSKQNVMQQLARLTKQNFSPTSPLSRVALKVHKILWSF